MTGVAGVDALIASLDEATSDLADVITTAAAEVITTAAAPHTPIRTGKLRAGFTQAGPVIAAAAPYAASVHARNPWITRAAAATEAAQIQAAEAAVQALLDDVKGT